MIRNHTTCPFILLKDSIKQREPKEGKFRKAPLHKKKIQPTTKDRNPNALFYYYLELPKKEIKMGCQSSKTKNQNANALPEDAAAFMKLVNTDGHPVARRVLEEWSILVDAKQRSISQGNNDPMTALQDRPNELWATTTAADGVTHESVDEVGKSFLKYLKNDLLLRKWAGTFDYAVAGW